MFTEDSFLKITAVLLRALGFNGSEILEILEVQNKLPPSTAADESDTPEPTVSFRDSHTVWNLTVCQSYLLHQASLLHMFYPRSNL